MIKRLAMAAMSMTLMGLGVPAESILTNSGMSGQASAPAPVVVAVPVPDVANIKSVPVVSESAPMAAPMAAPMVTPAKPVHEDLILLTVDKSRLSADLRTLPEAGKSSELLKSFRIAIGKEDGDKQREGDNRTPEGIYFTALPIDGKALPQKYGPIAIPIDFPNPIDKFSRKTGYGIWLHGVEKDTRVDQAKVTEGCVAFYNSDIESLTTWLQPDQAIVAIAHDATQVNRPEEQQAVQRRTQEWADAWKARDLERYMAFYSPEFVNADKNLKAWHGYKRAVFGSYKEMKVDFDMMRVITHPKYALSVMNQDFRGDSRFVSVGRKMLYWMRGPDGNWYITREVFENRKIKPMRFSEAEIATLTSRRSSASVSSGMGTAPNL